LATTIETTGRRLPSDSSSRYRDIQSGKDLGQSSGYPTTLATTFSTLTTRNLKRHVARVDRRVPLL
jgi:hypothetical protein